MATFISNVFYFFLSFLILVFIAISSLQLYYDREGPSDQDQLLIIEKGQSVANIASHLRDLNLIEKLKSLIFLLTNQYPKNRILVSINFVLIKGNIAEDRFIAGFCNSLVNKFALYSFIVFELLYIFILIFVAN